jgi:hypothetical protein
VKRIYSLRRQEGVIIAAQFNLMKLALNKFGIVAVIVSAMVISGCGTTGKTTKMQTAISVVRGSDLAVQGRSSIHGEKVELITSGAHFGVTFSGRTCALLVSIEGQRHNYLQYELDGVYQKRLKVNAGGVDTLRITSEKDGPHTLWMYKATEAHTGPIFIHAVSGTDVKPLPVLELPVIEFIGNSITCGAASDPSEVPCGSGEYHDQHNAYLAYGPRVARNLNADFVLTSVSGIGIYRNWNSDRPIMPEVYGKTDLQEGSHRDWDFKKLTPAVVSIALGTNDFSRGDGKKVRAAFDSAIFIDSYVKFVKSLRSKYPSAQIVLLNSPMVGGKDNQVFIDCLTKVKHKIDESYPGQKPVALFFFEPITPRGCTYHPSVGDHQAMADTLAPFLRSFLR